MSGLSQHIHADAETVENSANEEILMTLIMFVRKKAHVLIELAWARF